MSDYVNTCLELVNQDPGASIRKHSVLRGKNFPEICGAGFPACQSRNDRLEACPTLTMFERNNSLAETVIDSYALAGISSRDLDALCQEIATRLDVKVLAQLRKMRGFSRKK